MRKIFGIETYSYYNYSSRDGTKAVAVLRGNNGETCYVHFYGIDVDLPQAVNLVNNIFIFYYRYSDFHDIIDMLRNEKPISVIYESAGLNNSRISTSAEPIGEGEEH